MTDDDKPVMELDVTDINSIWIPPNVQGDVRIVFCTAQELDISHKNSRQQSLQNLKPTFCWPARSRPRQAEIAIDLNQAA